MAIYGYARVSTARQKVERQVENIIRHYPTAIIITEEYTGRSLDRPKWNYIRKQFREGDIIVFDEVSRMSRNADEGFKLYEELYYEGIELHFLKEPHIDTTTYRQALDNAIKLTGTAVDFILEGLNKYLMDLAKEQIRLAFIQAEKEVDFLRARTREGIKKAHDQGKRSGHEQGTSYETAKAKICKEIIRKHSVSFGGTLSDTEVIRLCGCSKNTYYKYKAELSERSA